MVFFQGTVIGEIPARMWYKNVPSRHAHRSDLTPHSRQTFLERRAQTGSAGMSANLAAHGEIDDHATDTGTILTIAAAEIDAENITFDPSSGNR